MIQKDRVHSLDQKEACVTLSFYTKYFDVQKKPLGNLRYHRFCWKADDHRDVQCLADVILSCGSATERDSP